MAGKYPVSRWHNDVIDTLEGVGLDVSEVRTKKHIVVQGVLNKHPFRWTTSSTPSNQNACRSMIVDLKRELRKCGVEEPPRFAMRFFTGLPDPSDVWEALWRWEEHLDESRADAKDSK